MALSIAQIENIKEEFSKGKTPKQIAEKIKENPYRINTLAKLLGFSFSKVDRNYFDWFICSAKYPALRVTAKGININFKRYKVLKVDEKIKQVTMEYSD